MRQFLLILSLGGLLVLQSGFHPKASSIKAYIFMGEKCVICRHYTLQLEALHQQYRNQGVELIGVFPNAYSTEAGIDAFRQKYKLSFDLLLDSNQVLMKQFNAQITPEVVVYDEAAGHILYRGRIDDQFVRVGRRRPQPTTSELIDVLAGLSNPLAPPVKYTTPIGCLITQATTCE